MTHDDLDALRDALPAWARDVARNVDTALAGPGAHLTPDQHWGTVAAVAATLRSPRATPGLLAEAHRRTTPEVVDAALEAASVMATNNVYFRARHFLHGGYDDLRAGLRMTFHSHPGVPTLDAELWCVALSAVNGCESCVTAHEHAARDAGATREAVNEALRVAAVVTGLAVALDATAPA